MPVCVAGHIGVGHVFSHSGFVQDDSQGFTLLASLLAEEHGLDMTVSGVRSVTSEGYIQVSLRSGGTGAAHPRRGFTPFESMLAENLVGSSSLYPQRAVLNVLGRIYGNGVLELPASLEYALAEAVMESFAENISGFVLERESPHGDLFGGVPGEIGGIPVTLLLSVNGDRNGTGPDENREGNIPLGSKRRLMEKLGIIDVPTVIVESKAYDPSIKDLRENSFMVRYNREIDNEVVGESLVRALESCNQPYRCDEKAFPSIPGTMRRKTENAGAALVQLGEQLARCREASGKAEVIAEIARFVSEDLGGVVFMSDRIHDHARSAGTMPGTSAVLSRVVTADYIRRYRIPFVSDKDIILLKNVLQTALPILSSRLHEAEAVLSRKKNAYRP